MAVDDTCEVNALTLQASAFAKQVVILRDQDSAKDRGSHEELVVAERIRSILLGSDDVDSAEAKRSGDGSWHVRIHVELDFQRACFKSLNFCWKAGSETSLANAIASC